MAPEALRQGTEWYSDTVSAIVVPSAAASRPRASRSLAPAARRRVPAHLGEQARVLRPGRQRVDHARGSVARIALTVSEYHFGSLGAKLSARHPPVTDRTHTLRQIVVREQDASRVSSKMMFRASRNP